MATSLLQRVQFVTSAAERKSLLQGVLSPGLASDVVKALGENDRISEGGGGGVYVN